MTKEELIQSVSLRIGAMIAENKGAYNTADIAEVIGLSVSIAYDKMKEAINLPTEQAISAQSILQSSKTVGVQAISQVYFRKGANWVIEQIKQFTV